MKRFFIITLSFLLLTACSAESTADPTPISDTKTDAPTTETISTEPTSDVPTQKTIMPSETDVSAQLDDEPTTTFAKHLKKLLDKISPITDLSGNAKSSFLRTIDGEMVSHDIYTAFTLADIGKYTAPFEGDIYYNVHYEFDEPASQKGYYFPYDYWYKNSSWYPMWHRESLADYEHDSEGVQHGFHPSPQKMLTTLTELSDIAYLSLDDPEQDLMEIGFQLETDTHSEIMNDLFLHPVEYHADFFDASRCWHYTDAPSFVYVVLQPEANELLSIAYHTEMYCDIIDATMEISSILTYDFEQIEKVTVPKDVEEEAIAEEQGFINPFEDSH